MKNTMAAIAAAMAIAAAHAQPATVEAVQYPAWLERDGLAVPLAPGTKLQARDRVRTGANSRVQVKLGEGSTVKVGENAQLVVERLEDASVFRAGLNMVTGAIRFTTDAASSGKARNVEIKAKNVTAGVRGTDLWGKATEDRDWVVLIEGRISVAAAGHPAVTLEKPLDLYQKPRDGAPEVVKADPAQLEAWARETDIAADGPAARLGGEWRVVAATLPSRDAGRKLVRELRTAGFPAELHPGPEKFVAVAVPHLASEPQARAVMAALRGLPGVMLPKVDRMP